MKLILEVLLVLLVLGCESGPFVTAKLDEEIKRRCMFDGGIKVYEKVYYYSSVYNDGGFPEFYHPRDGVEALGSDYIFLREISFYRKGNPELWRSHYKIIRKKDSKLLSESISYSRRGGDWIGPWEPSFFGCPVDSGDLPLIKATFIKIGR